MKDVVADVVVLSVCDVVVVFFDAEVVVAVSSVVIGLSALETHALRPRNTMGTNSHVAPVRRVGLPIVISRVCM